MRLTEFYEVIFGNYSIIQKALVIISIAATIGLYIINPEKGQNALENAGSTFTRVLLLIIAGTLLGSVIENVIPEELITNVLGEGSGVKGILIAALLGSFVPGGPYVIYPILASLYAAGVGLAPIITFIFAWSSVALGRVPFELAFFENKVVLTRIALGIPLPIIAGLLADLLT